MIAGSSSACGPLSNVQPRSQKALSVHINRRAVWLAIPVLLGLTACVPNNVLPMPPAPAPASAPAPVRYANCDAVRAAGAAPIYPGQPGWDSKFDRDNDGVGCE